MTIAPIVTFGLGIRVRKTQYEYPPHVILQVLVRIFRNQGTGRQITRGEEFHAYDTGYQYER